MATRPDVPRPGWPDAAGPPGGPAATSRPGWSDRIRLLLHQASVPLLRVSLGLVFVWFGGLKVADATPVADLVAGTLPWVDPAIGVPTLGGFEVALGLALVAGYRLPVVCTLLVAHLCGTFLTLVVQPQVAFQAGNPLLLTTEGEFVVKNLVLISAGLVVAARVEARAAERLAG